MKIKSASLPGASRLYTDYLLPGEKLQSFYRLPFSNEASFSAQMEEIKKRQYPREALVQTLKRQNAYFGASSKTMENLERLLRKDVGVIITGQQTGLFGGPLYVLYKALTAIKLANRLGRTCGSCVVPVFWLASDDADFLEVNHTFVPDKSFDCRRIGINGTSPENTPVAAIYPETQFENAIAEMEASFVDTEFSAELFAALRKSYNPQESMSSGFGRWLMHNLRDFGLILVDPADPEIKQHLSDIYCREIEEKSPSTNLVLQTSSRLKDAGYHTQVQLRASERLNLFYTDPVRLSLQQKSDAITSTDGSRAFSRQELLTIAQNEPHKLSPNVILRSITQDTIFPTVAYVAGPSEIAYFAQLKDVYAHFDVPMPIIYPRKSLTLLDPGIDRILDKYKMHTSDLWKDTEQFITDYTKAHLPSELMAELLRLKTEMPLEILNQKEAILRLDPSLHKMLEVTSGKIHNTLNNLEKKVLQAGKRQNEVVRTQLHKASTMLYPMHTLQERIFNFTPFLNKYGPRFSERIYEILDISHNDHQIVRL